MEADFILPRIDSAPPIRPMLSTGLLDRLKAQRSDRLFIQRDSPEASVLESPPDHPYPPGHQVYGRDSISDRRRTLQETPSLPFSANPLPHTRTLSPLLPASSITDYAAVPLQQISTTPNDVLPQAQTVVARSDVEVSASRTDDSVLMEVS